MRSGAECGREDVPFIGQILVHQEWFSKVPPPAVLGEAEVHEGGELPDVVPLVPEVPEPVFCRVEEALYGRDGEIPGHHHRLGQAGRSEGGFEVLQVPKWLRILLLPRGGRLTGRRSEEFDGQVAMPKIVNRCSWLSREVPAETKILDIILSIRN